VRYGTARTGHTRLDELDVLKMASTSGSAGAQAYEHILETVPADVRTGLQQIEPNGAYAWIARCRFLADALAKREDRCKELEKEAHNMRQSQLRLKEQLHKAADQRRSNDEEEAPALLPKLPDNPARGLRLLVVEDDPFQAAALETLCSSLGYESTVADSGEAALAAIAERSDEDPFDIILCDVIMPNMDGVEVKSRRAPNVLVPFVVLPDSALNYPSV